MTVPQSTRRPAGTGSLFIRKDAAGRETWYAKFRVGDRQIKRRIDLKRQPGSKIGLSRTQAEAEMRGLMQTIATAPQPRERLTVAEVAERYLRHVEEVMERRPTTVKDYRIIIRKHFSTFFAGVAIERVTPELVERYMAAKRRDGLATKTVGNHLNLLHGIFRFAHKRGWVTGNPVAAVDRPKSQQTDPDIRFLDSEELEGLIRAVPDDLLGSTDGVLYLTAAMTGLRQGELIALRWKDVDWAAGVVRVRRSYTRGDFGPPKSRRGSRAVPLADRVAGDLERHFKESSWTADDDLVFAHPATGGPYDSSRMRKRFNDALTRGGVRRVRFHDLRHTFGTRMAAAGAPLRALQEWMGHRDYKTTELYADYAPDPSQGAAYAARAFGGATGTRAETLSEHSLNGR